eukprot:g45396.t1
MDFNVKDIGPLKVCGDLSEQLQVLCRALENCLQEWPNDIRRAMSQLIALSENSEDEETSDFELEAEDSDSEEVGMDSTGLDLPTACSLRGRSLQPMYSMTDFQSESYHQKDLVWVRKRLEEFLFKILILGFLKDSWGRIWKRNTTHLYIVEHLDVNEFLYKQQAQQASMGLLGILPTIHCRSPREVRQLELKKHQGIHHNILDPLMDEDVFVSEAYQRPYQYLHTLIGFKNFIVEFMILMAQDFATPAMNISDESPDFSAFQEEEDLLPFLIRKRWETHPHPYIFFNADHLSMTFFGFHLKSVGKRIDAVDHRTGEVLKGNVMSPQLLNGLSMQRIQFNEDIDNLPREVKIRKLCLVLGIEEAIDPDETYELTSDNMMKMLAIHMRFRSEIPVIIMGETGCGKTRLIRFLCDLQKGKHKTETMKLVKVHGGTTAEIIYAKIGEAEKLALGNKVKYGLDTVLFFDEANTTEAIHAIKEVLCDKTVQGKTMKSNTGLKIIAACNPYRKHSEAMIKRLEMAGLGYRVKVDETEDKLGKIPLRQLVYRVQPLPPNEIGLAEDSPQMPLKALHPLLEDGCIDDDNPVPHKKVGFIGISNWALDPAKMNRGIFVSRLDPCQNELIETAKGICSSDPALQQKVQHLFPTFAKAYLEVCNIEDGQFFGLRDYYSLVKMVFITAKETKCNPTEQQLADTISRNFSGKDDFNPLEIFLPNLDSLPQISTLEMVKKNIRADSSAGECRYLLLLTKNYVALQIVLQHVFLDLDDKPEIIFGSSFPKDQEYTQICRNVNRVKTCMETGRTVILLNLKNLYESLYDALNQYYVTLGEYQYVDLGLGTHRVKCRVDKNFRLIVIEDKDVVYEQFPIPLINRLEKHSLDMGTVLNQQQQSINKQLELWVKEFVSVKMSHDGLQGGLMLNPSE